jgi:hypothetical protein
MSITWKEGADTRQNIGFSWIQQENLATFSSSDYVLGGYLVNPAAFGFGVLHGFTVIGTNGTPSGYWWSCNKVNTTTYYLMAWTGASQASASTDFSALTLSILGYGF